MTEKELVEECAEKIYKRFPFMKLKEAVDISWEEVKKNRKDNGEMDVELVREIVKNICGEQ